MRAAGVIAGILAVLILVMGAVLYIKKRCEFDYHLRVIGVWKGILDIECVGGKQSSNNILFIKTL